MDRGPGIRGSVLQRWLGKRVELHHAASSAEVTAKGEVTGPAETRIGVYVLEAVSDMGIEASVPDTDDGTMIYVPWNSVLLIQGPIPENSNRDPETEEATPPHGRRRELMDRLAKAQTATEVAVARGAADAWLAANPSDGDVRMALDRLPGPAGD
jgi:hypothetical protein